MGFGFKKIFNKILKNNENNGSKQAQGESNVHVTITTHEYTHDEIEAQRLERVNEIRELDKNAYISKNGLTPKEIMMLSYAEYYATDTDVFPRFWLYDYAIDDPKVILTKLLNGGFIQLASAADSLSRLTVKELKTVLEKHNLLQTGKKAVLIDRLINAVSTEELEQFVTSRKYVLTELGKEELAQNEYVTYIHNHKRYWLSVWDLNKMIHEHPGHRWRDLIWGHLNQKLNDSMFDFSYGNYGPYVLIKDQMVNFVMEEKRYRVAAAIAIECSYYRINKDAIQSYSMYLKNNKKMNDLIEYDDPPSLEDYVIPVSYELERYKIIKQELNLDDNGLFQMLIEYVKDFCKADDAFSADEIAGIIVAKLNDTEEDRILISSICRKAELRIML